MEGKATAREGATEVEKEVARERIPTTCRDRMPPGGTPRAADAVACILAANVQRTSTRPSVRSATYRDTWKATVGAQQ